MRWIAFVRAAVRYWVRVFPAVAGELRRRRALALEVPDPVLRRLALQALECKRCNLEGAAAVELIAGRNSSRALVGVLVRCQMLCDYLDLLAEQCAADPVANGYRLHEALIVALCPGEGHRDYYAHHPRSEDGGYLTTLVEDIQKTVASLPALASVQRPLHRAAERIVAYQSLNHGDRHGSHEPFLRWASAQVVPDSGMAWWEAGAAVGSTLLLFALIASSARPQLRPEDVIAVQDAYLPWVGALHTLLDSLVDLEEDGLTGGHRLVDRYGSPERAAQCMRDIAREALARTESLAAGGRHRLLVVAMIGFYQCEVRRRWGSAYAQAVGPVLLRTGGALGWVTMLMMRARHLAPRSSRGPMAPLPSGRGRSAGDVEGGHRLGDCSQPECEVCE